MTTSDTLVVTSSSDDQHVLDRSTYIGSSDAAMVADLSPWGSPLTVWNRLVGLDTPREAAPLRFWLGKQLEPIILDLYEQQTGKRPERVTDDDDVPQLSAAHPFIGAHVDFDRLEIKTARSAREWGDDGETVTLDNMAIPLHYFLQVQHQLFVMQWDASDLAVLIGHDEFRSFHVPADAIVIERLVAAEVELWEFAQRGEPPPKGDAAARRAYLNARFPSASKPLRPATPEEELLVTEWRRAKSITTAAELEEQSAAFRVQSVIGDSAGLAGLVTWKPQTRTTLDEQLLVAELARTKRGQRCLQKASRSKTFRVLRAIDRKEDALGSTRVAALASGSDTD